MVSVIQVVILIQVGPNWEVLSRSQDFWSPIILGSEIYYQVIREILNLSQALGLHEVAAVSHEVVPTVESPLIFNRLVTTCQPEILQVLDLLARQHASRVTQDPVPISSDALKNFCVNGLLYGYELWMIQIVKQWFSETNAVTPRESLYSALKGKFILLVSDKQTL